MSRPQHPNAGACKARRYPELAEPRAVYCSHYAPRPIHCEELYYSDCKWPDWTPCEDPGWNPGYRVTQDWAWRERALRAAAVRPCTRRWVVGIEAYAQAKIVFLDADGPHCALYVEHLHPAVQAAWTGRCVP